MIFKVWYDVMGGGWFVLGFFLTTFWFVTSLLWILNLLLLKRLTGDSPHAHFCLKARTENARTLRLDFSRHTTCCELHTKFPFTVANVRAWGALIGVTGPDQPHLGPPPTLLAIGLETFLTSNSFPELLFVFPGPWPCLVFLPLLNVCWRAGGTCCPLASLEELPCACGHLKAGRCFFFLLFHWGYLIATAYLQKLPGLLEVGRCAQYPSLGVSWD